VRLLGADWDAMAAVEAARCIRALTRDNSAAQDAAVFASTVEALLLAIATGAATLCARDATRTLAAVCHQHAPAQTHAHRCGGVDILLRVLRARDACTAGATEALAAILDLSRAADAAVQSDACRVLLPLLRAAPWRCAAGASSTATGARVAHSVRGGAAAALAAIASGCSTRADALVSAGALDAVEAALAAGAAMVALAAGCAGRGDATMSSSASQQPVQHDAAVRSPRTTAASQDGGQPETLSWRILGTDGSHQLQPAASAPAGRLGSRAVQLAASAASKHASGGGAGTARRPHLEQVALVSVPGLQADGVVQVCGLAATLAAASPVVQARLRGTSVLRSLVRGLLLLGRYVCTLHAASCAELSGHHQPGQWSCTELDQTSLSSRQHC
jgi:hypothetical protein